MRVKGLSTELTYLNKFLQTRFHGLDPAVGNLEAIIEWLVELDLEIVDEFLLESGWVLRLGTVIEESLERLECVNHSIIELELIEIGTFYWLD